MNKVSLICLLLCSAVLTDAGKATAANAKTSLLLEAVVSGDSIHLSDLLPESSPESLRAIGQKLVIADSPQPGTVRVLTRAETTRMLDDLNLHLLDRFEVPQEIAIRRAGHRITREDVAEAIRRAAEHNAALANIQISAEQVRLSAPVSTTTPEAALRITRMESDPLLHEYKFWMVSSTNPNLLPFIATVPLTPGRVIADSAFPEAAAREVGGSKSRRDDALRQPAVAFLAEPGKEARLHVVSGDRMQMYLNVVPLEHGVLGQTIRVRVQTTSKTLFARVLGPAQLEAQW